MIYILNNRRAFLCGIGDSWNSYHLSIFWWVTWWWVYHLTVYWFIDKSFDFRCWPFRWISRSHATWMQRSAIEFGCTVFSFSCHGSGSQRQGSQKYLVLHLRSHVRTDDRPSVTYCKTAATSQRLTRNFSSSSSSSSVSYIHNSRLLVMMRIPSRWLCWYEVCSAWVTCCVPPIWFAGLVRSFHSHIFFLNCRWWPKEAVVSDC